MHSGNRLHTLGHAATTYSTETPTYYWWTGRIAISKVSDSADVPEPRWDPLRCRKSIYNACVGLSTSICMCRSRRWTLFSFALSCPNPNSRKILWSRYSLLCRDRGGAYEGYWIVLLTYMMEYVDGTSILNEEALAQPYRRFYHAMKHGDLKMYLILDEIRWLDGIDEWSCCSEIDLPGTMRNASYRVIQWTRSREWKPLSRLAKSGWPFHYWILQLVRSNTSLVWYHSFAGFSILKVTVEMGVSKAHSLTVSRCQHFSILRSVMNPEKMWLFRCRGSITFSCVEGQ
jgi:hypothetical protein